MSDAGTVHALAAAAGLDVDPERELARDHAIFLVVRERPGEEALAFLLAWRLADEVELLDLATHPAKRRRGYGAALLGALIAEARAASASAIFLEVRPSNEPALGLYLRAGFEEVGRRPRYYSDGEDALLLRYAV